MNEIKIEFCLHHSSSNCYVLFVVLLVLLLFFWKIQSEITITIKQKNGNNKKNIKKRNEMKFSSKFKLVNFKRVVIIE